jgi:hypothetical protein
LLLVESHRGNGPCHIRETAPFELEIRAKFATLDCALIVANVPILVVIGSIRSPSWAMRHLYD